MTNKEIGVELRKRREELGLTCEKVAENCGVSKSTVSRWETGDIESIKRGHIYLLSKCLFLPVETILGIEQERNQKEGTELAKLKIKLTSYINNEKKISNLKQVDTFIDAFILKEKWKEMNKIKKTDPRSKGTANPALFRSSRSVVVI